MTLCLKKRSRNLSTVRASAKPITATGYRVWYYAIAARRTRRPYADM
jgi:hypothetical protein